MAVIKEKPEMAHPPSETRLSGVQAELGPRLGEAKEGVVLVEKERVRQLQPVKMTPIPPLMDFRAPSGIPTVSPTVMRILEKMIAALKIARLARMGMTILSERTVSGDARLCSERFDFENLYARKQGP
jgi:hypothetical protein